MKEQEEEEQKGVYEKHVQLRKRQKKPGDKEK